jgi:hypothetical protein
MAVPVMISRKHFWKFYEFVWLSLQFGQISGRISDYFGTGIRRDTGTIYKKKGRVNQPDIRCIPILNYFSEQRYRATLLKQCKLIDIMVFIHTNSPSEQDRSKQILYLSSTGTNLPN